MTTKPRTRSPHEAFAERVTRPATARLDVMLERVTIPPGTWVLAADEHPQDEGDAEDFSEQLHEIAMDGLRDDRHVLLLCCPERGETVDQAVKHGFRVYATYLLEAPLRLVGLRGRARRLLRGPSGVFVAFACDAEDAAIFREDVEALPVRSALSSLS